MNTPADFASGKDHRGENFPVGGLLIAPRHRPLVLGFYRVARMADDIADHPTASPQDKLTQLASIEATLLGRSDDIPEAATLRRAFEQRAMTVTHMLDLLTAFRRDVVKPRTNDWADLMDYCRYSACPVGRFMLDVHGEDRANWAASDALCAALQVINHLQDCGRDFRELDRVYVPLDFLDSAGLGVEALGDARAHPALAAVIVSLASRTGDLLDQARPLSRAVNDQRLGLEVGVIHALARSLNRRLLTRDPLSQRVHHHPIEAMVAGLVGFGAALVSRLAP